MCHQCCYVSRASLCLHLTFIWRRRCMLWNDFCADNKLNGNKESGCFCSTLWITLCNNDVLTALERAHDLPLRMFLSLNHHDRDNDEEYTNTRTTGWANLVFSICLLLTICIFNCCVGGTIAVQAGVFTFGGAWYRYFLLDLVTVLSLNGCVDHSNCTCNLLSSLDEYHHTWMLIFSRVFIKSINRQSW